MKVLICDDIEKRATRWRSALEPLGSHLELADNPDDDEVVEAIISLEKRRDVARLRREHKRLEFGPTDESDVGHNLFDDVDMVVLDYDLFWLGADSEAESHPLPTRPRVTGEQLAYLVRCFSRCAYIVGLNQFGENPFNLDLRGHVGSYADLNIGGVQLGNPGLWGETVVGFRPSAWPNLADVVQAQKQRIEFLADRMTQPVLPTLGLIENGYPTVPREALEFFGGLDPTTMTFAEFAVSGTPRGLDITDAPWEPAALIRIAASRVAKWLEREVLAGGEVLVDRPHLVERFPSLLGDGVKDLAAFDLGAYPRPESSLVDHPAAAAALFENGFWLSRPAWWWQRLAVDHRIAEVKDPWDGEEPPVRFCEDVSRFLPQEACLTYSADVHSPWVTRHVAGPKPLSQALGVAPELYEGPFSLSEVVYEPSDVLER
ncbi:MAG: hypothetical protein QOK43_2900 [Acidimicrobiaceae bacterium]|nr:hypothetical protein [Acidimicrobiaceae bacterium]